MNPQSIDHWTESLAAFATWLAVMLERMNRGEEPLPGISRSATTTEQANQREHRVRDDWSELCVTCDQRRDRQLHESEFWMPPARSEVVDRLLLRLEVAIRGERWESDFWGCVLPIAPCLIPTFIVDSLRSRQVAICDLGHLPLADPDLWKLIDDADEALLTLSKRRYLNAAYDANQFEEVLHAKPQHHWMLWSLVRLEPSDSAKARVLVECVKRHPERDELIRDASGAFRTAWEGE